MFNVNFLGLTSQQGIEKPETAGSIAFISTPQKQSKQLFMSVPETAGSIASGSAPSSTNSSTSSTIAVA